MNLLEMAGEATVEPWSSSEWVTRFGSPILVILLGLMMYVVGRSERRVLRGGAADKGGFGGPPGTTDVGSAQGFGVEERAELVRASTRKLLIGLFFMLAGTLTLLGVTFWRIFA